jgi:stearoyl-CoA desaturase (delta-9 desaturase)
MATNDTLKRPDDPIAPAVSGREQPPAAPAPGPDDIEPAQHETRDRIITGAISILPFLALGIAAWRTWEGLLHPSDVVIFLIMYIATGLGVTVGFHRLLTHRAFKTSAPVRGIFAALGSVAIEGPVISWVADHRKHHAFSDKPGDPHSPHVDHGVGLRGALRGLAHAHMGWLFIHTQRGLRSRYAPDLLRDPVICFVHRTFLLWVAVGFIVPFGLGWLIGGTLETALTALLWGGLVRIFVLHHVTYSINSWCHFAGRRRFATKDESRNVLWLAIPSFGESWHNNHHAFPTSAHHGMRKWEVDPSAALIWLLEKTGLAWDVVRVSEERQARKIATARAPAS